MIPTEKKLRLEDSTLRTKPRCEYFLYGEVPVLFIGSEGKLSIQAFKHNQQRFEKDRTYWRLIEFDKSNLARKLTRRQFNKEVELLGGTQAMIESTIQSWLEPSAIEFQRELRDEED